MQSKRHQSLNICIYYDSILYMAYVIRSGIKSNSHIPLHFLAICFILYKTFVFSFSPRYGREKPDKVQGWDRA